MPRADNANGARAKGRRRRWCRCRPRWCGCTRRTCTPSTASWTRTTCSSTCGPAGGKPDAYRPSQAGRAAPGPHRRRLHRPHAAPHPRHGPGPPGACPSRSSPGCSPTARRGRPAQTYIHLDTTDIQAALDRRPACGVTRRRPDEIRRIVASDAASRPKVIHGGGSGSRPSTQPTTGTPPELGVPARRGRGVGPSPPSPSVAARAGQTMVPVPPGDGQRVLRPSAPARSPCSRFSAFLAEQIPHRRRRRDHRNGARGLPVLVGAGPTSRPTQALTLSMPARLPRRTTAATTG